MNEPTYMGLDISTSHIGICISTKSDKIILFENFDLSKLGDMSIFDKAKLFRLKIIDVFEKYGVPEKIYVEKALLMFKGAASRIQVIVLLQQFNALCQFVLYELGHTVTLIASSTALKATTGYGRKPKFIDDKKAWTAEIFIDKHPEVVIKKYDKGKNIGKVHSDMYDPIDAWLMSRSHVLDR